MYNKLNTSVRGLSELVSIGKSTIARWINNQNKKIVKNRPPHKRLLSDSDKIAVVQMIDKNNLITLSELKAIVFSTLKITVSRSTLSRLMKDAHVTYKKARKYIKNANVEQQRSDFKMNVDKIGEINIACLDEVGFQLKMRRENGWAKKGERCLVIENKHKRINYHAIFVISQTDIQYKIYDKPINIQTFGDFIKDLQNKGIVSKTILLDNLRVHHNVGIKTIMNNKFAGVLWTPSYSPQLNPIEMLFSSLKAHLRKQNVNTKTELVAEIENYLKNKNNLQFVKYYKHAW